MIPLRIGTFAQRRIPSALSSFTTYFGRNITPFETVTGNPLTARQSWESAAGAYYIENFEGLSIPTNDFITMPSTVNFVKNAQTISANISVITGAGTEYFIAIDGNNQGRFATSGVQFMETDWSFIIDFGSNYFNAFGFYATDVGDIYGNLTVELTLVDNTVETISVSTGYYAQGNLIFWGFVSNKSYKKIKFINSTANLEEEVDRDVFGFDDFVVRFV